MHANISIILSLLTISINSINCTNLCNSTESITTLSPPKKRIQPAKRIVSNNDSIEIPESRVTLENLGGGKVRKLFTGRISGWCPADFEADWAVFLFFFFNSGTRWLHVRPPAAIDQPRKLLPVQIFFPPFVLELARTTSSRPAFPIHLLRSSSALREASSPLLSSPPRWKKSTRPGFQTADLFFHVAIYFFTPACTGWMRKESSKGEPTTTTTTVRLSHPYFFLSLLLFSFYFPFLLPSLASHSIRTGAFLFPRSKFNDEWLLE